MSIRVWCNKIGLIPSVLCGLVLLAFYVAVTPLAQNNSSMGLAGYAWILALYVALCVEAGLCGYKLLSQAKEEGRWLTVWVTGLWLLAICAPPSCLPTSWARKTPFRLVAPFRKLMRTPHWDSTPLAFSGIQPVPTFFKAYRQTFSACLT